jgi:hypothetical protein
MISPYLKGKQASVMVWACFSGGLGASELILMDRDTEAPKQGYSSQSYCKTLEVGLLEYYEEGMFFMQDNAPIHKSGATTAWLTGHGINVLEMPPYSPDLNPIENMWAFLKELLCKLYPELLHCSGSKEQIAQQMGL